MHPVLQFLIGFSLFLDANTVRSSNDDGGRHVAEETVVDNAAHILQISSHLPYVLDGSIEMKIDNVVSIIGDGNFITVGFIGGR